MSARAVVRTVGLVVLTLLVVGFWWGLAGWELCGMSGCGGGGFGRNYEPESVLSWLALSGVAAAAGPAVAGRRSGSRRLLGAAVVLLLVVPVLGGLVIGARPDGYPRSVSQETIDRDLRLNGD